MTGTATHQAAVLAIMASGNASPLTLDQLDAALPIGRKKIASAAGKLISRAYLERLEAGTYALTLTGRKALEAGTALTSGPHRGKRKIPLYRDTLQQRAWAAMRLNTRFTIGDIATLAAQAEDRQPERSLQRFFHRLRCAGYLIELPVRARGIAGTSPGHKVFKLSRDTGEHSPRWIERIQAFRDWNTREVFPCA